MRAEALATNTHRIQNREVHKKSADKTTAYTKPIAQTSFCVYTSAPVKGFVKAPGTIFQGRTKDYTIPAIFPTFLAILAAFRGIFPVLH
jgi:hypothetical protein